VDSPGFLELEAVGLGVFHGLREKYLGARTSTNLSSAGTVATAIVRRSIGWSESASPSLPRRAPTLGDGGLISADIR
jgi:hypothetical protein